MNTQYTLRVSCKDSPGIVAAVATALSAAQCNIEESAQFNDPLSGRFFMRVVFSPLNPGARLEFENHFTPAAEKYAIEWSVKALNQPVRTLIMVSKTDHCLNDILYRTRTNHLNIEISSVVSNHEINRALVEDRDIAFHHLPLTANTKAEQEQKLRSIIEDSKTELIVLARYMQILSPELCTQYAGRIINIHHSFLPGFKGTKPYHQAYERGVKIIGATAHFATPDLDEGPIIEQETRRIDHSYGPGILQTAGCDTEAQVLARAIRLYTERRIFMHGKRTIIL